ncbi:MAG TPA: MFS transporter [Bryobacteraceae bacterium]|nr:MFS transporter [Bryobacteraceae bacterium]
MKRSRVILVALLFLLSWITYLDRAAISTAKELMAGDLGLSDQTMGIVFGCFALGYAVAQVPAGWFADRFGPRTALTAVVAGWSLFTAVTGAVSRISILIVVRFLFGMAEAGVFPGAARTFYNWLPSDQHGKANGIIFSGSRLGAAFSFPILAALMDRFGWRLAFFVLGFPGILWAAAWLFWFRDQPPQPVAKKATGQEELHFAEVFRSRPMLLAMAQYFASNFTFFICISWMHPYLMSWYHLSSEVAAWYSTIVLLIGATAQWITGFLVDRLYRSRCREFSRSVPAIIGFLIAAAGLIAIGFTRAPWAGAACFALATFGVEMTISPSWSFCIDLGKKKSGSVSGAMNMVGNLGSFVSASLFPLMYQSTGDAKSYFLLAAALNVAAATVWLAMRAGQKDLAIEESCNV